MPPRCPEVVASLLLVLGRAGVELAAHRNDPVRLRVHRGAIPALLGDPFTLTDAEAGYVFGERLGVAGALGMPNHAGAPA